MPGDNDTTVLSIADPTPDELATIERLGKVFLEKGFVDEWTTKRAYENEEKLVIKAPLEKIGPLVVANMRPGPAVLTAITFKDGKCLTTSGNVEELVALTEAVVEGKAEIEKKALAKKGEPKAAATVKRPTP